MTVLLLLIALFECNPAGNTDDTYTVTGVVLKIRISFRETALRKAAEIHYVIHQIYLILFISL